MTSVTTTRLATQLKPGSVRVDKNVADFGRSPKGNTWAGGRYCREDVQV